MDKNLEIFSEMMDKLDTKSTMEEFVGIFEQVLEHIKEEKDLTEAQVEKLKNMYEESIKNIRSENESSFNSLKEKVLVKIEKTLESIQKNTDTILQNAQEKVDSLEDGADADEEVIVSKVIAILDEREVEDQEDPEETPEEVRDKLESLPEGEKIEIDAIQDLRKELDELKQTKSRGPFTLFGGSKGHIKTYDLSSQLDGTTTTFNLPANWTVINVSTTSFPGALRPVIDYTFTPTSITFTSEINPATTLATGQTVIVVYEES